jgi:signal transduction histidine kinase/ActR/RegA family two-component response regulator
MPALNLDGFLVRCDPDGRVAGLVLSCPHELPGLARGVDLEQAAEVGSRGKLRAFLAQAGSGPALGWEINLRTSAGARTYIFGGCPGEDGVLAAAGRSHADLLRLVAGAVEPGFDVSPLRVHLTDTGRDKACAWPEPGSHYDEISRLNNELINAQRQLAKKNARLEILDRQKNTLLGMVAHDLRNPLGLITGYVELLEENLAGRLGGRDADLIGVIREAAAGALTLIEDMLDVSVIESGELQVKPRPVELRLLVDKVLAMHRPRARRKGIDLAFGPGDVLWAELDPGKFQQVASNLVSNAVKYSPPGSRVEVELSAGTGGVGEAGEVVFAVRDQGPGISAAEQKGLFKAYGRSSARTTQGESSTGLGLLIVKKVAEAHGGRVVLDSAPGRGSVFGVRLPGLLPGPPESAVSGREGLHMVVVDDEAMNRRLLERFLTGLGCRVTSAATGEEALEAVAGGDVDCLFLDLEMDGMDGWEVLAALRAREEEQGLDRLRVVAVTGHSDQEIMDSVTRFGVDAWLVKPVDRAALARVISDFSG